MGQPWRTVRIDMRTAFSPFHPLPFTMLMMLPTAIAFAESSAVSVTVNPSAYTIVAGASKTFWASVSKISPKTVTWSVNGVTGGNATVGKISDSGQYTAPALPPAPNVVKIRATSTAMPTVRGEAVVTVNNPVPSLSSVTPNLVNVGSFSIRLSGKNFVPGSKVLIGDKPVATFFVSATELKATATETSPRETEVAVANPDPGGKISNKRGFRIAPPVTISVTPEKVTLRLGVTRQFRASAGNTLDRTVTWYVNGIKGGNTLYGTIDEAGLYTPPVMLPPSPAALSAVPANTSTAAGPVVNVKAVSNADPKASDTAVVTLQNAIPVITSANPGKLVAGSQVQLAISGTGFAAGAQVLLGSTPLTVHSLSPTAIVASGKAGPGFGGMISVSLRNPDPGAANSNAMVLSVGPARQVMTAQAAARFLERTTWGPTPDSIQHLQETGIPAFLQEQFAAPISELPEPIAESTSIGPAQRAFYLNAMTGQDQLRQRVAFALSQILVVSGVKTPQSNQLVPYMRMLSQNAFGNYFTLLRQVTLSPTMGRFLDMVNNRKETKGVEPNENYARELLQLFTLGLEQLNRDGTPKLDPATGKPIPTYSEADVKQFARAFTGWTYPTRPGETPRFPNPTYYAAPMIAFEEQHDATQKTLLLGDVIPPGRTASEEVDLVIDNLRKNPNVAPFVAIRLIQRLVMGNPSGAYISRVASVFEATGGDLWQTTKAIVTDPEADSPQAYQGKLREPVLFILSYLRGMNAAVTTDNNLNGYARNMGEDLWFAPSVFNYFSPFYRVNGQVAPEFQISTPSVALNRVNFIYRASRNGLGASVQIDLAELERLAFDPPSLVEALNQALMHGSMSAAMKSSILTALSATSDTRVRARNAAYLAGSASQFQVEP
ncbi:MAG: hypothetical protein IANPNBLG_04641 [Bryobacteraceae bacterium]|nr:hypothetical protein [Bryobacteraceae bacterium]